MVEGQLEIASRQQRDARICGNDPTCLFRDRPDMRRLLCCPPRQPACVLGGVTVPEYHRHLFGESLSPLVRLVFPRMSVATCPCEL